MDGIREFLGLGADDLSVWQVGVRTVVVYICALVMVRIGEKRFLGKSTAFDVIVGIMLGSIVSRAITNASDFWNSLVAGFLLVGMHYLLAMVTFRSDRLGDLIKGRSRQLVKDGQIDWDEMAASHVSEQDLVGALRREAHLKDVERAKSARLERNGDISVIKQDREPQVMEVQVRDGVQTLRIEIS